MNNILSKASTGDWGRLPHALVPPSALHSRLESLHQQRSKICLQQFHHEEKITRLLKNVDDHQRLLRLVEHDNVPGLRRLPITHCRNGYGLSSFIEKLKKASTTKVAGDNLITRVYN